MRMRVWVCVWVGVWLVLAGAASAGRAYVASRIIDYTFGGAFDDTSVAENVGGVYSTDAMVLNTSRAAKIAGTNGVVISEGGTGDAGVSIGNVSAFAEYLANNGSGVGAFSMELWLVALHPQDFSSYSTMTWLIGTLDASSGPETVPYYGTYDTAGIRARRDYEYYGGLEREYGIMYTGSYNYGKLVHMVFAIRFEAPNTLYVDEYVNTVDGGHTMNFYSPDGDPPINPSHQLILGRPKEDETAWQGTVYSFSIYSEHLNQSRVTALYNEGILNQRPATTDVHRIVFTDTLTPLHMTCVDADGSNDTCALHLITLANHTALFIESTEETRITAASGLPYLLPLNQTTVWIRGQAAVSTETSFTFRVQDDGVGELQSALATAYLHVAVILHPRVEDGLLFEYALRDGHRAQDLAFTDVATDSQGNLVGPGSLALQLSRVAWISNTTGLRISGTDTTLSGSLSSRSVLALLT